MGQAVPVEDLPGTAVPTSDLPGAVDNSQYAGHPISTFLANAINSATFGLPDYLNRKFTPEQYAEAQRYIQANPVAATAGDIAGYAVPTGAGVIKGAQLGARGASMLASRVAPELAANPVASALTRLYGQATGAATGGTMGAQMGAAAPGLLEGNPAKAVAGAELVNQYSKQIPGVSPLGGVTGHIIPSVVGIAAENRRIEIERARAILAQPPTAQNFIQRMEATATLYGTKQ